MMERERIVDLKILELKGYDEARKFSVEPTASSEPLENDYLKDLVEEAVMDASAEGKNSLDEIADAVVFSLKEEGYLVRDFPNNPETLLVDVSERVLEPDEEYGERE